MAPNPSIGRTSDLAALGLHAAIYGQSPAPSEWPKFALERTVVALAILANCSDHRFTGARMMILAAQIVLPAIRGNTSSMAIFYADVSSPGEQWLPVPGPVWRKPS
jgi:hypothetical protein